MRKEHFIGQNGNLKGLIQEVKLVSHLYLPSVLTASRFSDQKYIRKISQASEQMKKILTSIISII